MIAINNENDEYEIKAIIRNAIKYQYNVVINDQYYYHTKLKNINNNTLQICTTNLHLNIKKDEVVHIEIHDKEAKHEFQARLKNKSIKKNINNLFFFMPPSLTTHQRRSEKRINIEKNSGNICTGRFNNGTEYSFLIKDLSGGGCALITNDEILAGVILGYKLRMSNLNFGCLGSFTTNLVIVNVTLINDSRDSNNDLLFRLSCQFKNTSTKMIDKLNSIIISLLIKSRTPPPLFNKK